MAFDITDALAEGIRRTVSRVGLTVAALLFVIGTLNELVGIGVARWYLRQPWWPFPTGGEPFVGVALNPAVGGLLSLLLAIASLVVVIAAVRTFVTDETEAIPPEHYRENLLEPGLNLFVGAIVFGIALAIGFVLLVIPGLYLLVALGFWFVFVAVEGRNFISAFEESWALTRGNRLNLFLLLVAVVLLTAVVSAIFAVGEVAGGLVALVIAQVGSALTGTFTLATVVQAYRQLRSDEPASTEEAPAPGEAPAGD